jgi:hypothetical protein
MKHGIVEGEPPMGFPNPFATGLRALTRMLSKRRRSSEPPPPLPSAPADDAEPDDGQPL